MIRSLIIAAAVTLSIAGAASGAVAYNGHPITARVVGGIDASPCTSPYGCAKAIVELRTNGRADTHLVRCAHPRRLHVASVTRNRSGVRVDVFACGRDYLWRLP